nr:hypothetical protein CFP56_22391 [Quercus suber]
MPSTSFCELFQATCDISASNVRLSKSYRVDHQDEKDSKRGDRHRVGGENASGFHNISRSTLNLGYNLGDCLHELPICRTHSKTTSQGKEAVESW